MIRNVFICDRCKRKTTRLYTFYSIGRIEDEPQNKDDELIKEIKRKELCNSCMTDLVDFVNKYDVVKEDANRFLCETLAKVENLICQSEGMEYVETKEIPNVLAEILEDKWNNR